jgi:hypothetical protein
MLRDAEYLFFSRNSFLWLFISLCLEYILRRLGDKRTTLVTRRTLVKARRIWYLIQEEYMSLLWIRSLNLSWRIPVQHTESSLASARKWKWNMVKAQEFQLSARLGAKRCHSMQRRSNHPVFTSLWCKNIYSNALNKIQQRPRRCP